MSKPRFRYWRFWLALLLGAGTWWGVGWWLSPKPWFEARYVLPEAAGPDIYEGIQEVKPGQKPPDLPKPKGSICARVLENNGRYLMIGSSGKEGDQYSIIDLLNRNQQVCSHTDENRWAHEVAQGRQLIDPDGTTFITGNYAKYGQLPFWQDDEKQIDRKELWKWNVFTNQAERIKSYAPLAQLKLSENGSTFMEISREAALLPSLFLPWSFTGIIGTQVEAYIGMNDLAVMRVWSLPDMTLRCTVALPWKYGHKTAELTPDGAYFVLTDSIAFEGFATSKSEYHRLSEIYRVSLLPMYPISLPKGISVYDTQTGQLYWHKAGYAGNYSIRTGKPMMKDVVALERNGTKEDQIISGELTLHLPSRTSFESHECVSASTLDDKNMQLMFYTSNNRPADFVIKHVSADGKTAHQFELREKNHDFTPPCLVENSTQYVAQRIRSKAEMLPVQLYQFLQKKDLLTDWLKSVEQEICVVDYQSGNKLFSAYGNQRSPLTPLVTDRWLTITSTDEEHFYMKVYALPMLYWSPWWSRGSGLVVWLFTWFLLRRKAKQQG